MPRSLTRDQLEARKEKAVRFVRDVLADPDRAEEIADESLEDYAARRKIEILDNPSNRRCGMPRKTVEDYKAEVADLKDEMAELEDENEDLQDRLDQVMDIVAPEDEEEEGEGAKADEEEDGASGE